MGVRSYLKYELKNNSDISKKRAEAELNKFMREYREKEDKENKAVEQLMKEFMHDIDVAKVTPQTIEDLKSVLANNSFISKKRAKAEVRNFVSIYTSEYIEKKSFLGRNKTEEDYNNFLSEYNINGAEEEKSEYSKKEDKAI